jgi:hypothetical protein
VAIALGVILVFAVAVSAFGAWRLLLAPRRVLSPEREMMRDALLHVSATLPHLRRGLNAASARAAAPHLRLLTQAAGVAITNSDRVLAHDGAASQRTSVARLLELSRRVADCRDPYEEEREVDVSTAFTSLVDGFASRSRDRPGAAARTTRGGAS